MKVSFKLIQVFILSRHLCQNSFNCAEMIYFCIVCLQKVWLIYNNKKDNESKNQFKKEIYELQKIDNSEIVNLSEINSNFDLC